MIKHLFTFTILSLTAIGTAHAQPPSIQSDLVNNKGAMIGTVDITKATNGVILTLKAKDLPPGAKGMHFHETGNCDDHQHFKNSKGHIMPTGKPHGFFHADGPHEGNLPNLIVHDDGTAHVELYSNLVQFNKGDAALMDGDGSALIIHTNQDDHITQPIGGSGARIACAVIPAVKQLKSKKPMNDENHTMPEMAPKGDETVVQPVEVEPALEAPQTHHHDDHSSDQNKKEEE